MIDPFDSFRLYQAIKLHFDSDSYDAVKYNFKTSANPKSFFKRRDKYFFAKLGRQLNKQNELIDYYVSNFVRDVKWVGDMLNEEGSANYREHQKIHQALSYHFEEDISELSVEAEALDSLLKVIDNEHPQIIKSYLQGRTRLETVVILDKMTGFMNHANNKLTETIIWPDIYRKVSKYRAFVNPEISRCKKIVLYSFSQ